MTRTRPFGLAALVAVAGAASVVTFSGRAQAAPVVPEGFLGVPWGASPEDVEKAMAERHYAKDPDSKPDRYIYVGSFAGERAYVIFSFINDKLFEGGANLIDVFRDAREGDYRGLVDQRFRALEESLVQKYGDPAYRYPGTNEPWKPRSVTWNLEDQQATVIVTLGKNYAFKDKQFDINSKVAVDYKNISLQKKELQRSKDRDL
jgi:hypothetical protein